MVGEASSEDKEKTVADKGADRGRQKRLPQDENMLMREKPAEERGTFALGDTAQKYGNQPILLDEIMDGIRHERVRCFDRISSIRFTCSASCAISSRMPTIWLWRSSSSFSCSAMISISALRLTS